MADFKDSDFKPGEGIIYGIGAWITRYIIYYESNGTKKYNNPSRIPEGEWNDAHIKKSEKYYAINTWNQDITNAEYKLLQDNILQATVTESSEYMEHLNKSVKYRPQGTTGKVDAITAKLRKSNANLDFRSAPAVCAAAKDMAIRRSSKFGIQYVVETFDGKVHYILDDIDQEVLLKKSTITNGSSFEKIPICTSELRYLFRNWGRYKTAGKVVFWKNYTSAVPPWKDSNVKWQVGWAVYALQRMRKHRARLVGLETFKGLKDKEFDRLVVNVEKFDGGSQEARKNAENVVKLQLDEHISTPADIITLFHGLAPDTVNDEAQEVT